ncbi:MAG: hypothetical protein QOJ42_6611, partial [Acidobacteriaceae bacterium]|nr:hypothetical protein [Acidobacteriaceae bacterium]
MKWRWQNIVERGSLLLLAVLAACIPFAPRGHAQSANAQLTGLITDLSNAAVPGAQIQAVNAATNVPYAAVSNSAGNYVLPEMLPGAYNITVSASGFGAEKREGLILRTGDHLTQNFALKPGAVETTVTVTSSSATISSDEASTSQTLDNKMITELPQLNRNS